MKFSKAKFEKKYYLGPFIKDVRSGRLSWMSPIRGEGGLPSADIFRIRERRILKMRTRNPLNS